MVTCLGIIVALCRLFKHPYGGFNGHFTAQCDNADGTRFKLSNFDFAYPSQRPIYTPVPSWQSRFVPRKYGIFAGYANVIWCRVNRRFYMVRRENTNIRISLENSLPLPLPFTWPSRMGIRRPARPWWSRESQVWSTRRTLVPVGQTRRRGWRLEPMWHKRRPGRPWEPVWYKRRPGRPLEPRWPRRRPVRPLEPVWPRRRPERPLEPMWPTGPPEEPLEPEWPTIPPATTPTVRVTATPEDPNDVDTAEDSKDVDTPPKSLTVQLESGRKVPVAKCDIYEPKFRDSLPGLDNIAICKSKNDEDKEIVLPNIVATRGHLRRSHIDAFLMPRSIRKDQLRESPGEGFVITRNSKKRRFFLRGRRDDDVPLDIFAYPTRFNRRKQVTVTEFLQWRSSRFLKFSNSKRRSIGISLEELVKLLKNEDGKTRRRTTKKKVPSGWT